MSDKTPSKSATVHSVVVAASILEFLAEGGRPQRVTDIAQHLEMTKARISRHLTTLADLGLVAKMPDHSGYRLGSTLFRLANAASDQYEITNIAYRFMQETRNRIKEAMLLAIPAGGDALVVSTLSSGRALTPNLARGARFSIPVSPTAWVILTFSPDFIRERVLARRLDREPHRADALEPAEVRRRCAEISKRFYEFAEDPHDAGFSVLSAPIFNFSERIEAAMTIVMNRRRSNSVAGVPFVNELLTSAIEVSRTLGSVEMANRMAESIGK